MANKFHSQPQVKPIHFFKIITAPILHEGKLMIPTTFVEKYGENLPSSVFLKPPNGTEWELNLVKCDDKIWFEEGWKEFAERHSLAHGHLLVFRYERTSHFQVHIFDMSTLEIDYPFKRVGGNMASNDQGNKAPNNQNLDQNRPGQKRKEKAMINTKQVTALDRASSFKTFNPSFLVVMLPSYVGRGPLNLPSKFCKKHFDLVKERGDADLRVLNGRVWSVRYIKNINTVTKFHLSGGWKTFVKDNNLQVGDICTFELIPRTKLTFYVHIFKESESSNCSTSQGSGQMKAACQEQREEKKIFTTTKSSRPKSLSSFV